MEFFTILILYYEGTLDRAGDFYVFKNPQECSQAMPKFYNTGMDLLCLETDVVSGYTIRPKARPVKP